MLNNVNPILSEELLQPQEEGFVTYHTTPTAKLMRGADRVVRKNQGGAKVTVVLPSEVDLCNVTPLAMLCHNIYVLFCIDQDLGATGGNMNTAQNIFGKRTYYITGGHPKRCLILTCQNKALPNCKATIRSAGKNRTRRVDTAMRNSCERTCGRLRHTSS